MKYIKSPSFPFHFSLLAFRFKLSALLPIAYCLLLFTSTTATFGQTEKFQEKTVTENGYTYTTVTNDPINARLYTLKNGLKVYLSVYKDAPRIQTYIAVKAGSKNDPSYNTGLAHYLEHILFKGTSKIGTSDWAKEKPELDKIEALYEQYKKTKPENEREKIYHQIDSISLIAATYAIANEYDKMLGNIGATGTNAYTWVEQTVYVNDIPSNQVDKWAEIEAERFHEMVPRLFHTELEAVYEEKNKGLDNDNTKVWEALFSGLFQNHPYGTQTTIGTVEHLKNPSITEIRKYFNTYYVPNNMAICLSGDMDPDATIKSIDKYFGKLQSKAVPTFTPPTEQAITNPKKKVIYGSDAENINIAFRFPGNKDKSSLMLEMISMILSNGEAGLIDLHLLQQQKVLSASAYALRLNDYSMFVMSGKPKKGQTLEEVRDLLLGELNIIKQGKFDDWLLKAIVNDYKTSKMKELESNKARASALVDVFTSDRKLKDYAEEIDLLSKMTKQDLVDFTNKNFSNNYLEIYKMTGVDSSIQKVKKPKITAVSVNREKQSEFYKMVTAQPSPPIEPVFVDYANDIQHLKIKNEIPLLYKQNKENELFDLSIIIDIGKEHDPKYGLALSYLNFLGTKKFNAEQLKQEFYKLGCSMSATMNNDAMFLSLSGLRENFTEAFKLFEQKLTAPMEDQEALKSLVDRTLKAREDSKLSKSAILQAALVSYGKYGPNSPFKNILSVQELKAMKAEELTAIIKSLLSYKQRMIYYGPEKSDAVIKILNTNHIIPASLKPVPAAKKFPFREINENLVYWTNYNMVQAEMVFLTRSVTFDKALIPAVYLFNEYFGGGMGSLVFQEMRESKALAYGVYSRYSTPGRKDDPNYVTSYIGTQADKIMEAIDGLNELIENMPESDNLFVNAQNSIIENVNTQRITKASILYDYEKSKKLGIDYDIRRDIYKNVKTMTFNDIKDFQQKYLKGQKKIIVVVGSKDKIDFAALSKYGKVQELTLEEIFGY